MHYAIIPNEKDMPYLIVIEKLRLNFHNLYKFNINEVQKEYYVSIGQIA